MELSLTQIRNLVDALGDCPCMMTGAARDSVVSLLDPNIQASLERGSTLRLDIWHILRTCLGYPGGAENLLAAIQVFDHGSSASLHLSRLFEEYNLVDGNDETDGGSPAPDGGTADQGLGDEFNGAPGEPPSGALRYPAWLKAHGFSQALFSPLAGKIETDPLFQGDDSLMGYVDPDDFEQLLSYKYFFIPPGGGKTGLCRRILSQYQNQTPDPAAPAGVLVVGYDQHEDYALDETAPHFHLRRIIEAIGGQHPQLTSSMAELEHFRTYPASANALVKAVQAAGYREILVLVDPIARSGLNTLEAFRLVRPLAERSDHDPRPRLRYLFFLDPQIKNDRTNHLDLDANPPAPYQLTAPFLRRILKKRFSLAASEAGSSRAALFENGESTAVEGYFIKVGLQTGSIRAMWQYGERLLREHFKRGYALEGERISGQLAKAVFEQFLAER